MQQESEKPNETSEFQMLEIPAEKNLEGQAPRRTKIESDIVDDVQLHSIIATQEFPKQESQHFPSLMRKGSLLSRPMSKNREKFFKKYPQHIILFLKAKFVLEEIIEPIINCQLLNLNDIFNLELMYLMSFRAWVDIQGSIKPLEQKKSYIHSSLEDKQKQSVDVDENINSEYFQPFIEVGQKIEGKYNKFQKLLYEKECGFQSIMKNIAHTVFWRSYKNQRAVFLCAYEGIDFKRAEQIEYTQTQYIQDCIKHLSKTGKKSSVVISKLSIYKDFMQEEMDTIEGFDDFLVVKDKLLKELKPNYNAEVSALYSGSAQKDSSEDEGDH